MSTRSPGPGLVGGNEWNAAEVSLGSGAGVFSKERGSAPLFVSHPQSPPSMAMRFHFFGGWALYFCQSYPGRVSRSEVTCGLELRLVEFSCSVLHISFSCTWIECQFTNTNNPILSRKRRHRVCISNLTPQRIHGRNISKHGPSASQPACRSSDLWGL